MFSILLYLILKYSTNFSYICAYLLKKFFFISLIDSFFSKPTYHVEWTRPNEYTEIRVSSKMLLDHLPNSLDDALERLNVPYEEFAAQV